MPSHVLDNISLGKIVKIRERLLDAQAAGTKVYRFESGDPSFSVAPHVLAALQDAAARGQTHYVATSGIPALRAAIARKLERVNDIRVGEEGVFVTNGAMHALFATFDALLDP